MTRSFDEIFSIFGGPAEVGRIIAVTTEHAVQMRRRGSIPPEHWPALVQAAEARGIEGISHDALIAARKARRPQPEKAVA